MLENERNLEEDESISDSIDESYADDNSDNKSIGTYDIENIWCGSYAHPNIKTRDARLKIRDRIRQSQNKCKGE